MQLSPLSRCHSDSIHDDAQSPGTRNLRHWFDNAIARSILSTTLLVSTCIVMLKHRMSAKTSTFRFSHANGRGNLASVKHILPKRERRTWSLASSQVHRGNTQKVEDKLLDSSGCSVLPRIDHATCAQDGLHYGADYGLLRQSRLDVRTPNVSRCPHIGFKVFARSQLLRQGME